MSERLHQLLFLKSVMSRQEVHDHSSSTIPFPDYLWITIASWDEECSGFRLYSSWFWIQCNLFVFQTDGHLILYTTPFPLNLPFHLTFLLWRRWNHNYPKDYVWKWVLLARLVLDLGSLIPLSTLFTLGIAFTAWWRICFTW